ncbi:hypothetical protein AX16_008324 [Volvariella volvacea WC 439]|nr:hypothetical protein AX16_008324 [Volvariella volvacea WC 439]
MTKTTRSFVQTLKGAAKAATYAIGQGKPSSSKALKAKEMDTATEGERDITPTQHHARKAGDIQASVLAKEEEIFERVANWTPPNNDHLVYWDPLSGTQSEVDTNTFLGCEFKAAAYTKRYDIKGWMLYRTFKYPNTDVFIYLPANIPLEEMQVCFFLACCGLQIFPEEMRDYRVPQCILKFLTNAGLDTNPHWILAGDANPFIPVHRVGSTDDDVTGDIYTSPEPVTSAERHDIKSEEAEGLLHSHNGHVAESRGPAEEADVVQTKEDWSMSPATTYRTPSVGNIPLDKGKGRERSMSPHRYLSPMPALTAPTPPANQLAVYLQINIPFQSLVIPQEAPTAGSVQGRPTQVDSLGTNITETLRNGVNRKKHVPTPYVRGENMFIRSWDDILVIPKMEYVKAGGRNGRFKSKTYDSDTIPDVPQAAFVDEGDADAWAEWSVEAMRNIAFITDFGRYDRIAKGLTDPSQFEKISVFTNEQKKDLIAMMIQLITSLPTDATTEADWLRSINKTMPWMYVEESEDLAIRVVQIEAAIRSTDRACDYIHRDYMSFAGAQDGKTLTRE